MDLFLYLLNGAISFWGLAVPCWAVIFMMKKGYKYKQILFNYICMLIVAIYYWSNIIYNKLFIDLLFEVIGHIIIFVVTAIMIYLYKKHQIKKDKE